MKITKTKITWIVGLLAAILTAVLGYLNTSCTAGRSAIFHADSLHVNHFSIESHSNAALSK